MTPRTLTTGGGDPSRTQHPARPLTGRGGQALRSWNPNRGPLNFSAVVAPRFPCLRPLTSVLYTSQLLNAQLSSETITAKWSAPDVLSQSSVARCRAEQMLQPRYDTDRQMFHDWAIDIEGQCTLPDYVSSFQNLKSWYISSSCCPLKFLSLRDLSMFCAISRTRPICIPRWSRNEPLTGGTSLGAVGFLWCLWCIKLWDLGGATAATRVVTAECSVISEGCMHACPKINSNISSEVLYQAITDTKNRYHKHTTQRAFMCT